MAFSAAILPMSSSICECSSRSQERKCSEVGEWFGVCIITKIIGLILLMLLGIFINKISYLSMDIVSIVYSYFAQISALLVAIVLLTHLVTSLLFRPKRLVLNEESLIVITGACMGIGKQMALQFARKYHPTLLIIDRRDDLFQAVGKQLQAIKCKPAFLKTDLSNDQQISSLIKHIQQTYPKIDLLVYNAGIVIPKRTFESSAAENSLVMKVNYFTPIQIIHGLESKLAGGHVAVVSSMAALASGGVNFGTYGASKGAIYHYISSLRQEYKKDKKNITVSLACPYAINTGMFHGFKMVIEPIVPILDEVYVGKRMVKEFAERKEVCYIKPYAGWILRLMELLPSQLNDWMWISLDSSDYDAIKNKHDSWVKGKKDK